MIEYLILTLNEMIKLLTLVTPRSRTIVLPNCSNYNLIIHHHVSVLVLASQQHLLESICLPIVGEVGLFALQWDDTTKISISQCKAAVSDHVQQLTYFETFPRGNFDEF